MQGAYPVRLGTTVMACSSPMACWCAQLRTLQRRLAREAVDRPRPLKSVPFPFCHTICLSTHADWRTECVRLRAEQSHPSKGQPREVLKRRPFLCIFVFCQEEKLKRHTFDLGGHASRTADSWPSFRDAEETEDKVQVHGEHLSLVVEQAPDAELDVDHSHQVLPLKRS